jgi:hypothetical protein
MNTVASVSSWAGWADLGLRWERGSWALGATVRNWGLASVSDHDHENARRFASYDDFEELELHSTILIDANGRVHWKRNGGDPFTDVGFLIKTVKQMNGKP